MIRRAFEWLISAVVLALVYLANVLAGYINEDPMGECQWPRRDD